MQISFLRISVLKVEALLTKIKWFHDEFDIISIEQFTQYSCLTLF